MSIWIVRRNVNMSRLRTRRIKIVPVGPLTTNRASQGAAAVGT